MEYTKTDNNNHISRSKLLILYTQYEPKPMVLIILTLYESSLLSVSVRLLRHQLQKLNYKCKDVIHHAINLQGGKCPGDG